MYISEFKLFSASPYSVRTWPLYYDNPNYEIRTLTSDGKTACSVAMGTLNADLNYNPVCLDGSANSYVEQRVPTAILPADWTISIMASTGVLDGGTIFHYKEDDGNSGAADRISSMIFWYDSTTAYLEVYKSNNERIGYLTVANFFPTGANIYDFITILVSYDISKPEVKIFTNQGELGQVDLTGYQPNLGVPGTLRIGGAISMVKAGFEGQFICLSLFSYKSGPAETGYVNDECEPSYWISNPAATAGKHTRLPNS